MNRKHELAWEIAYYAIVLLVWWLTTRDGPPLRVIFWYHLYRTCQAVAYRAGSVGLQAEHTYHCELEKSRL